MSTCSECGKEVLREELVRCVECSKTYCKKCADKNSTIKELGVCPDCEEVYTQEEDYWGWGRKLKIRTFDWCKNDC